jgi:hypothetical protein
LKPGDRVSIEFLKVNWCPAGDRNCFDRFDLITLFPLPRPNGHPSPAGEGLGVRASIAVASTRLDLRGQFFFSTPISWRWWRSLYYFDRSLPQVLFAKNHKLNNLFIITPRIFLNFASYVTKIR